MLGSMRRQLQDDRHDPDTPRHAPTSDHLHHPRDMIVPGTRRAEDSS